MIQYMFITNSPDLAEYAESCGVGRIFVDLETLGKQERQGHLDTLISQHSIDDIPEIKSRLKQSNLLVRVNPLHANTENEVEQVLAGGADLLMLPMFETATELRQFSEYVNGRAGIIPLVETYKASCAMAELVKVKGLTEIYIGLNDLHLDMKLNFMFEPLANGFVDDMVAIIKNAGLPFGFGGVARVGEGLIPGEAVLAEHARLGSNSVILSRTFHRQSNSVTELENTVEFRKHVALLKDEEVRLTKRSPKAIYDDMIKFRAIVNEISRQRDKE